MNPIQPHAASVLPPTATEIKLERPAGATMPTIQLTPEGMPRSRSSSSSGHPRHAAAEQGRETVRQSIQRIVSDLKMLLLINKEPKPSSTLHLDALIASEQVRKPWLNLRLLVGDDPVSALVEELGQMETPSPGYRWHAVIDEGPHRSAVSIKHGDDNPRKMSAIFIESRSDDYAAEPDVPEMLSEALADKGLSLSIRSVATDVQRGEGCSFFALSAVKYMGKSASIGRLHTQLLADTPAPRDGASLGLNAPDAAWLEPEFFKHATSRNRVDRYLAGHPASVALQPVNKKGQTLAERLDAHMTTRVGASDEEESKLRTYSTSIENKRIHLYESVLATLGAKLDRPVADEDATEEGGGDFTAHDAQNLLRLASGRTKAQVVRRLERLEDIGVDARVTNAKGESALHLMCQVLQAAEWSNPSTHRDAETLVASFIESGIEVNARSALHRTPLFDAMHSAPLTRILIRHGADVNAEMQGGYTPIFGALSAEVVEVLLQHGADLNHTNEEGLTPLRSALRRFNLRADVFPALIGAGAVIDEATRSDIVGKGHLDDSSSARDLGTDAASWLRFFSAEANRSGLDGD